MSGGQLQGVQGREAILCEKRFALMLRGRRL